MLKDLPDEKLSPMNLDKMMNVIEIKMWIAFFSVLVILVAVVVWGFFGTMQVRVDVSGTLVRSGKIINIYATEDCMILDFTLNTDSYVERNQVAARIAQPDLVNEINLMINQGASEVEIEAKRAQLIEKSQILASGAGRVVDTYVHTGDYVRQGTRLATISQEPQDSQALECLLFIPAEKIKSIKKGQSVHVFPSQISRQSYGSMKGVVSIISEYPVTMQYMVDRLGSEELAGEFMKMGACYEVYINLTPSEDTVTGYEWTTSMGPSKKFGDLMLCDAVIIVEELRPIDVFFFRS